MAEPTELVALRRTAIEQLRSASIENAEIDVDLLLAQVLHCDRLGLLRRSHDIVGTDDVTHFLQLLESRGAGRPVSRILGRREFWSLNFEVTDAGLDPRSDSETLVEAVPFWPGAEYAGFSVIPIKTFDSMHAEMTGSKYPLAILHI